MLRRDEGAPLIIPSNSFWTLLRYPVHASNVASSSRTCSFMPRLTTVSGVCLENAQRDKLGGCFQSGQRQFQHPRSTILCPLHLCLSQDNTGAGPRQFCI